MIALVSEGTGGSPRRRRARGPWVALAGVLVVYTLVWIVPWHLHPTPGEARLVVSRVLADGRLEPLADLAAVPADARLALTVGGNQPASVVVVAMQAPGRVTLVAPGRPPTRRLRPDETVTLDERVTLDGKAGVERYAAVLCRSELAPATVLKSAERALLTVGGDPDGVRSLDLGCAEAFAAVRKQSPR